MVKLIGLYGPSRAGKDSVANILDDDWDYEHRNLATPIRNMLLQMNPWLADVEPVKLQHVYTKFNGDWDLIKKHYPDSVDLMIGLGQAGRDFVSENIWLDACTKEPWNRLVIADVRQPNEYHWIKNNGGQVWKVERIGLVKRGMDGLLDDYEFDFVINNDGTLEDLEATIEWTMYFVDKN